MKNNSKPSKLYLRIQKLRWQVPIIALLLVLIHQLIEHGVLFFLPRWQHFATQVFFYGLIGPVLAWWTLTYIGKRVAETDQALQNLQNTHSILSQTSQRLEFLIRVNRKLSDAEDENELINTLLELPYEVVPALGCSFIRFDERDRPLAAFHHGELTPDEFEAWAKHLSTPERIDICSQCSLSGLSGPDSCPLLQSTDDEIIVKKVFCLDITRGKHRFGKLNIFLDELDRPTEREQTLLHALADEMSLVLESTYLRTREREMLNRLKDARRTDDLNKELSGVLRNLIEVMDVNGGMISLSTPLGDDTKNIIEMGENIGTSLPLLQNMIAGVIETNIPVNIQELKLQGEVDSHLRSLLIHPIQLDNKSIGGIALWDSKSKTFTVRHVHLVTTVSSQAALIIENNQLYLEASYQATIAERARLSREIHDGLAQTLGYLKLRNAQIIKWFEIGETTRANEALKEIGDSIAKAFVDAREAIDGLRLKTNIHSIDHWLEEVLIEFENLSLLKTQVVGELPQNLPPEIQTQLQRIIQEALSNIRKHSNASIVKITWNNDNHWLTLTIGDNGDGFEPEEVHPINQHGLRIMRERAELLDGEFQITSQPDQGTKIIIRFPEIQIVR